MKEIYKSIKGFDKYEVSNLGNVRSLNYKRTGKIRNIKLQKHNEGYLKVSLRKDNKSINYFVHQLVAIAFLNHNINSNMVVNHINEDRSDNKIVNLEVVTYSENYKHSKDKSKTTSKYFGVYFNKNSMKYITQIHINKKIIHLGHFETEEEANDFYNLACNNIEVYSGDNKEFRNYLKNNKI